MGDTKFRQTGRRTASGPYRSDEKRRRVEEALERQQYWDGLSPKAKLEDLHRRAGLSKAQVKKLEALLSK